MATPLAYFAMAIHSADLRVPRKLFVDNWTRAFKVYIPVLQPDVWQKAAPIVSETLKFLTGDEWSFDFRQREQITKTTNLKKPGNTDLEIISLLSGGLDSLIGAIDLLEQDLRVGFVGHHGAGITNCFQEQVGNQLKLKYAKAFESYRFWAQPLNAAKDSAEASMRGRSFLFFSLGVAVACSTQCSALLIAENGLISLNVPLTPSRAGSLSTRTTHPHYISLYRKILNALDIKVELRLPYKFQTKGEMLRSCKNQEVLEEITPLTMSCSHPESGRFQKASPNLHCGYCVPCIIRKSAINAAQIADCEYRYDILSNPPKQGSVSGQDLRAFQIALEKNKETSRLDRVSQVLSTGPIEPEEISAFVDVYERGMDEVRALLE